MLQLWLEKEFQWEYVNAHTTCTYYHALDHEMEDCPELLIKWQEKRGGNLEIVTIE